VTFLQSSYLDFLSFEILPFYTPEVSTAMNFFIKDSDFLNLSTQYSLALSEISILNLVTSNQGLEFSNVTYDGFLILNLESLGLSQEDFLNLFPNETLSKVLNSPVVPLSDDINIVHSLPIDELSTYTNLETVKSQYHSSVPLRKLQYPEPFIASASFIHTDIGFVHVLQYNY